MKEDSESQEYLENGGKFKNWLQDNIRIILSILIVATIAAGIYSYSKRTVVPVANVETETEVNLAGVDASDMEDSNAVVVVGEDDQNNKVENSDDDSSTKLSIKQEDDTDVSDENSVDIKNGEQAKAEAEKAAQEAAKKAEAEKAAQEAAKKAEAEKAAQVVGEESGEAFVETAIAGDGVTTLARRATKHYLEKNSVEGLSAEHKIYIEDYLRKHVNHSSGVNVGEKVGFSKDLIKQAIDASKNLNDNQIKNLHKYVVMVGEI